MISEMAAFLALLILSLLVSFVLFSLLRASLHDLLKHTAKLSTGVSFFLRSFLLVLVLSALSATLGTSFVLKPEARFMEYVWTVAGGLSSVLEKFIWIVVVYVVLITVLVAALKIKNDQ